MIWQLENAVFAFDPAVIADRPAAGFANPFDGTRRQTLPAMPDGDPIGMEVVAGPRAALQTLADADTGCCIYAWGRAAHARYRGQDLLRWCAQSVQSGDLEPLTELLGQFVLMIDDRRNRRVHLVSDPLGMRPWLIGQHKGRWVGGSSLWPIIRAGLASSGVDHDAVAGWIYYGYDCNGGSLLKDYRRLAPGAVSTIAGGRTAVRPYLSPQGGEERVEPAEMAERIYHHLSQSFDALTTGVPAASLAITGGYDSRVLAAMALQRGMDVRGYYVQDSPIEAAIARQVADILGLPLTVIPTDGSLRNVFGDDPYHCLPTGFPITRQFSHVVAEQRPGVPVLNGFMGDILVRVTGDRNDRALEYQPQASLGPFLTTRRRLPQCRTDLFDGDLERRIERRADRIMSDLIHPGCLIGKPFLHSGLYGRQRCYTSNNFLSHLDVAEALVPFYAWPMIDLRFRYDVDCFRWETYEELFRQHHPAMLLIPHPQRDPAFRLPEARLSHSTRQWAVELVQNMRDAECLRPLNRRKALPRLMAAMLGRASADPAVGFLHRLLLLENQMRQHGMTLNWDAM